MKSVLYLTRKEIKRGVTRESEMGIRIFKSESLKETDFLKIGESRRLSPMDSSEFTIQYVGGMANVRTCDESLYHRV